MFEDIAYWLGSRQPLLLRLPPKRDPLPDPDRPLISSTFQEHTTVFTISEYADQDLFLVTMTGFGNIHLEDGSGRFLAHLSSVPEKGPGDLQAILRAPEDREICASHESVSHGRWGNVRELLHLRQT